MCNMSAPGNAVKLRATHSTKMSVPGWDRTYNALVSTLLSRRISPLCHGSVVHVASVFS